MHKGYSGYQDFYSNGPYAQYLLEHRLVGSTTARLLHVAQPPGAFPDPPLPEFLVYLALRGSNRLGFDWGCGRWQGAWRSQDISIAPPNIATDIHVDQDHAFLALALPERLVIAALDSLTSAGSTSFGALHERTFRDDSASRLCMELWAQARAGEPPDKLATDSLVFAMIATLARRAHGSAKELDCKLEGRRLVGVRDFIEDRLGDDLTLADLARVANASPMYFARQFRRGTGQSPHRYVVHRRIARARALLALTNHSIVEIAVAVGFSSQAHMTSTFSNYLGITPARYRVQRRN
jgi:AraC family transcriptional regulator